MCRQAAAASRRRLKAVDVAVMPAHRGRSPCTPGSPKPLTVGLWVVGLAAGRKRLTYLDDWTYQDVQETRVAPAFEAVFTFMLVPAVLFAMGLFFLLAGLLTPGSLDERARGASPGDRLRRLGVPWAAFALALWPLTVVAMYRAVGAPPASSWADLTEPPLDTGPLWFLLVLLLYSLGHAAWSQLSARLLWTPAIGADTPARGAGCAAATWRRSPSGSRPRRSWSASGSRWAAPRSPTSSRGSGRSSWRCSGSAA